MCRFAAYIGAPLLINDVISKPRDSLIKQSLDAKESDIKMNGDGFGIGWYNNSVSQIPAIFVSILPAWNDMNLKNISHQITSTCFFAHVRAAGEGAVALLNCHPFHFHQFMFMHNGGIGGFKKIKLALFNLLDEDCFLNIKGETDTETLFALWLTYFFKAKKTMRTLNSMVTAWQQTITTIEDLQATHQVKQTTYINAAVTDGIHLTTVHYSSNPNDLLSLHYTAGKAFVHTKEGLHMLPSPHKNHFEAILIASERLTIYENEWQEIPAQHLIAIDHNKTLQILSVKS